ncbi:MAG TPA: hypothetical protein PK624_04130 [Spirochaetota bacterium]|mgnify:CR=1 FL=1|nr:hypothetical protein [Spirochaetota bacterium]HOR43963.1 hypothetical protein [Spirochaetota bacterium]HOU85481.1 hypothetical protein [Spirochaetota bacterium]HPK56826.1 hypothetical protein [Spirochaetota bacterium]HQE59697.1 hypothetical protein [Spirochaetota bacterium]
MDQEIKYYTPKKEKDGKKLTMVVVFAFAVVSLYVVVGFLHQVITEFDDVWSRAWYEKIFGISGILMLALGAYSWIRQIVELWINAYTVELTEEKIIGYTAWNKRKELRYEEIETIEKEKFMFHSMNLKDAGGKTRMTIHLGINGYGKCVEEIRRRSKNVKKVDYRGVDKKAKIWLDEHKRE